MSHSHDDESFFREVEEDYRRDQTIKFFQTYGSYFIAGAFVILSLVAGYKFQQNRRASQAAAGGDALSQALNLSETGKQEEAQKALATLAQSGPGAYRLLARLNAAAEFAGKQQLEPARAEYAAVAKDEGAPEGLRDFAKVQLAALSLDKESFESLSRDLGALRLGTSRWRYSATEILGLAAFKEGKTADAERLFGEIVSDGDAPRGMRQRAEVMLALLLQKPKAAQTEQTGKKDAANDAKTQ
ncbi:MAG: tetratricopeptide repeat protein [Rhodomicrobium sp.]